MCTRVRTRKLTRQRGAGSKGWLSADGCAQTQSVLSLERSTWCRRARAGLLLWLEPGGHLLGFRIKTKENAAEETDHFSFQWYKNNFVKNDFQHKMKSRTHL